MCYAALLEVVYVTRRHLRHRVNVFRSLRETPRHQCATLGIACGITTATLLADSEVLGLINDSSCRILQNLNAATTSIHRLRQGIGGAENAGPEMKNLTRRAFVVRYSEHL